MTYPAGKGPSVGAGESVTSPGPRVSEDQTAQRVVDESYPQGPSATGIEIPSAHNPATGETHRAMGPHEGISVPTSDTDGDNGLPDVAMYEGPAVPEQPAVVNPSAGNSSAAGGGVNPMGPAPTPGSGPASDRVVYPDTTQGNPR